MSFNKATLLSGLIAVIAIAVACGGSEPTPTPTPTPTVTPSPTATLSASMSALESDYFEQVREAQALTMSKFENFGKIFTQAWPFREQLISALLEAGVGTAFTGTLEALEGINPPEHFQATHQSLVEATRELARLDAEAARAVEDGDMARFALINGQLGDVNGSFLINLPGGFCNNLHPTGSPFRNLCAPVEQLPGGEYGVRLNQMLREFQPQFQSVGGVLGFPLSLQPEELAQVFSVEGPIVEKLLQEIRDGVGSLTPPAEFLFDHEVLIGYLDGLTNTFREVTGAAEAGDLQTARMELLGIEEVVCEARGSFSSPDFKSLVRVHFEGGPDTCD